MGLYEFSQKKFYSLLPNFAKNFMNSHLASGFSSSAKILSKDLQNIAEKIYNNERITDDEGLLLFDKGSLPFLGSLGNHIREKLHVFKNGKLQPE